MNQSFAEMMNRTWSVLVQQLAQFIPRALAGFLILLLGILVARLVRGVAVRFFLAVRLDRLSDRMGISAYLARGDVRHTVAEILATVIYWLVLIFSLYVLTLAAGMETLADFFSRILAYIPRLLVVLAILLGGIAVGSFFGSAVQVAASNAGFPGSKPLGTLVKYLVSFFALVVALEELEIATHLLVTTLLILIAAVSFGAALAFGLGCKQIAGDAVRGWLRLPETASPKSPGRTKRATN